MHRPLIDHRSAVFGEMVMGILDDLATLFGASNGVMIFPSSATGCWESALVNTLSPGDRVLLYDNGFFARKWGQMGVALGLDVIRIDGDWRLPVDSGRIASELAGDDQHRQDGWGVDVAVCGSQKGLMLPPGLGLCAASERAVDRAREARLPRAYWDWQEMREMNRDGFFPSTPPTSLLFGLREALDMLREEGHREVFSRHARLAEATRRAAAAWGLENYCAASDAHSAAGTTLMMPDETGANAFRDECLRRFDLVLGGGLGPLKDRVFRIGHLGDLNALMLAGTLAGVEMVLRSVGASPRSSGVGAALDFLQENSGSGESGT
jgi:alanine-glyoxylate transaminase/serine-glyoxylate transaminase/serine-pyruvate transaminase